MVIPFFKRPISIGPMSMGNDYFISDRAASYKLFLKIPILPDGRIRHMFRFGIFMEGWRELHKAQKENRLATDRLYGLVRHPQYTGLFIALFGEGIVHWPTVFSVALFPIIVAAYYLLARSKECKVEDEFGDAYRAYRGRVPMFIPRWGQWRAMINTRI